METRSIVLIARFARRHRCCCCCVFHLPDKIEISKESMGIKNVVVVVVDASLIFANLLRKNSQFQLALTERKTFSARKLRFFCLQECQHIHTHTAVLNV